MNDVWFGRVCDIGGGAFNVEIDRNTVRYPNEGTEVAVVALSPGPRPDKAAVVAQLRRGQLDLDGAHYRMIISGGQLTWVAD